MKYTLTQHGVEEVRGCFHCPHMEMHNDDGWDTMFCTKPIPGKPKSRKLTTHWNGNYHASCPLPSERGMVPDVKA